MRRLIVGGAVLALTAGWASPAAAAQPLRVTVPIESSFEDTELSAECGFAVLVSEEGHITATVIETPTGHALEVDRLMIRVTVEAPSTGKSFTSLSNLTETFFYPEGAVIGAPAAVTRTGTFFHDPGVSATAGRLTWEGTIIGISDDGIPLVLIEGEPLTAVGRFPDDFDVADLCAALT